MGNSVSLEGLPTIKCRWKSIINSPAVICGHLVLCKRKQNLKPWKLHRIIGGIMFIVPPTVITVPEAQT